jgi:hypothetical protein
MAQMTSKERAQGWSVVRQIGEKWNSLFFDIQEDAEAAAVEARIDCQVCWLSYRDCVGFRPDKDRVA